MANWRINFIQWQSKADNVNKALAMPSEASAEEKSSPEKTASKKAEPSTTAIP